MYAHCNCPRHAIVKQMNNGAKRQTSWRGTSATDETKTACDASCGDGAFLGEILIRKVENGIEFEKALSTIYGVDIMQDNVDLCRERLLCGQEHLRPIVEKNIVCADALRYHYRFDGSDPYKTANDLHFDKLFG